jgi:hypothetical protein
MALVPGAALPRTDYSRAGLIVAGMLVGFGTRMGNGCAPPLQGQTLRCCACGGRAWEPPS